MRRSNLLDFGGDREKASEGGDPAR